MAMHVTAEKLKSVDWRTPAVVVACGCLIAMISFGPRSSLGFFLTPLSQTNHWGRDVFAFAVAIQNLLWGIGQPFAGGIADRFGTNRVLCVGAALYALGLAIMARSTTPEELSLSAGVLIGLGRMSADSEFIAMNAAGMGLKRILVPVGALALLAAAVTLCMTVWLGPLSVRTLRNLEERLRSSQLSFEVQPRVFNEQFPHLVLYVQDISAAAMNWHGVF